ncbi:PRELI/MSF1 domain - like 1 [Theobroma cacao]|nr:PRELI/MSF1 domain - like 1 [Theobroma cacao]
MHFGVNALNLLHQSGFILHSISALQSPLSVYATRALTRAMVYSQNIIGQDVCHCVESTVVDAQSKSMQLTTRNVSLQKLIEVEQKIMYDPHPHN